MKLKNALIRNSMQAILQTTAWLAQRESLATVSKAVMAAMARGSIKIKGFAKRKT